MSSPHVDHLRKLSAPGLLGFGTHWEITEIFASIEGIVGPQNVFTIAVLEERNQATLASLLNPSRLKVSKLANWTFGIQRTILPLSDFLQTLDGFAVNGVWNPSGEILATAELRPVNAQFVPADWTTEIPVNRVLKNNFWSGSHVFEWADPEKSLFKPFFKMPDILNDVAATITDFVTIDLSAVSDRLGNILVQVPVTLVNTGRYISRAGVAGDDPHCMAGE